MGFIVHATESGGVLFNLMHSSQFGVAIHIARQAYEKVSEQQSWLIPTSITMTPYCWRS